LLLFNRHTHKGSEEGTCYSKHFVVENYIHTHIREGGKNIVIIERVLFFIVIA
jgi:hypothetical protein